MMRILFSIWLFSSLVSAKTLEYSWDLSWKFIAPDGFGRPVISVNGQWPPPHINGVVGDRVIVHVSNNLGNEAASIHWHGINQIGQNTMDGPVGTTQCPIPAGSEFTYDFNVQQAGTYWWHAHVPGQIVDGLRGPMNFKDPDSPYRNRVDEELSITLGDWYHAQAPYLIAYYESATNAANGGPEPLPDSGLINSGQNITVKVEPGRTYLLRVVNLGNFVGTYFEIEGHQLTIIEADGVYVDPVTVDQLYLTVAQRYAVLVTIQSSYGYGGAVLMKGQLDTSMFDAIPMDYNPNFYGYLTHDLHGPLPPQNPITNLNVIDDIDLVTSSYNPYVDQVETYDNVDHQIIMTMDFTVINNQTRAIVNNVTYVDQTVPTLYTALTVGEFADNPIVYGNNSNPFIIKTGEVVEVIINNHDAGSHPWHTHGYNFQVIARNPTGGGDYTGGNLSPPHARPLRRDTTTVNANGFLALRFKANNPGAHLVHCHIEWHVIAGLSVTFIESPTSLQGDLIVPLDHLAACRHFNIPTSGNAAGNQQEPLNLTGAPTEPPQNPMGALIDISSFNMSDAQTSWPFWSDKGHHHLPSAEE